MFPVFLHTGFYLNDFLLPRELELLADPGLAGCLIRAEPVIGPRSVTDFLESLPLLIDVDLARFKAPEPLRMLLTDEDRLIGAGGKDMASN